MEDGGFAILAVLHDSHPHAPASTPSSVRGDAGDVCRVPDDPQFLLYGTVVVFDKIKDNVATMGTSSDSSSAMVNAR